MDFIQTKKIMKGCTSRRGGPMFADEALALYGTLSEFERVEIQNYSQVWFVGHKSLAPKYSLDDFDYDDGRNFYKAVINDHIAYRYEILEVMGQGGFGQVVKCWDHKEKEFVAIKVVRNIPSARTSATEEVRILSALQRADEYNTHNIVRKKDHFDFRGHLCIVLELLGDDLYAALEKRGFKGWSQEEVRSNAISLLKCFQLLEKKRIVHCDLKPANIVMLGDGQVKVIDFGLAYYETTGVHESRGTIWYRPPELTLGKWSACTTAIDMWSLGCTLAELSTGTPLFWGFNEVDQMARITAVLGVPSREFLMGASNSTTFFAAPKPSIKEERPENIRCKLVVGKPARCQTQNRIVIERSNMGGVQAAGCGSRLDLLLLVFRFPLENGCHK